MAVDVSSLSSALSMASLPIAFAIGFAYVLLKPRRRGRTRLRTALRVTLTRHVWLHSSTLLDFQYVVVSRVAFSILFSYTLLTGVGVGTAVSEGLAGILGPHGGPAHLEWYVKAAIVLALYVTSELAYWFDHFLSHKIPFLWEFHKVHHSATVLTPFTNYRVHPVDTILYLNIQAVAVGAASGLIKYVIGDAWSLTGMAISGVVVFNVYMALWGHLQHSQLWIAWTGRMGRVLLSPAHHQIHHSREPAHFDKNFGASLAVWDSLFGTLHIPQRQNEHIRLGTEDDAHLKRFVPSVLHPFRFAAARAVSMLQKGTRAPLSDRAA